MQKSEPHQDPDSGFVAPPASLPPAPAETTEGVIRQQSDFAAASPPESHDAAVLLTVAYALMWALVLGFIGFTWRRQRSLDARIAELEQALGAERRQGETPVP